MAWTPNPDILAYAGRFVDSHDGSYTLVPATFAPIYVTAGLLFFFTGVEGGSYSPRAVPD